MLELTEHLRGDDYDTLVTALDRVRRRGVRVAVDDAGAGYASLHHVRLLRPDIVKLDTLLTPASTPTPAGGRSSLPGELRPRHGRDHRRGTRRNPQ